MSGADRYLRPIWAGLLSFCLLSLPLLVGAAPDQKSQKKKPTAAKKAQGNGSGNVNRGRAAKKGKSKARSAGPALPPLHIDLVSLDLASGTAQVQVAGSARAPESRFFTFTDERKRRFVPSLVECHPGLLAGAAETAQQAGQWQCALGIPRIYQRAALSGISLEHRGQVVAVMPEKVQSAWAEARAVTPLQTVAERPREPGAPWGQPRRAPDGGPAQKGEQRAAGAAGAPALDSEGADPEAEEQE